MTKKKKSKKEDSALVSLMKTLGYGVLFGIAPFFLIGLAGILSVVSVMLSLLLIFIFPLCLLEYLIRSVLK